MRRLSCDSEFVGEGVMIRSCQTLDQWSSDFSPGYNVSVPPLDFLRQGNISLFMDLHADHLFCVLMATYSCTAGGNAVVDRVIYIMLENLSITLKTTALCLKLNYAWLILAIFEAVFHPRRYEYNILLHQIQISN